MDQPARAAEHTPSDPEPAHRSPLDPRAMAVLFASWTLAAVAGLALVMYGFGPFFLQRSQRGLMRQARAAVSNAANESTGLGGVTVPTKPPTPGAEVGILEIGAVKMQQAVVEGVDATDTRKGPGHVVGTAGLGQPGNSVVVGHRTTFGHPFSSLHRLEHGDSVVVTTTQGQSVYRVASVRTLTLSSRSDASGKSSIDGVYGPSPDDRLTLVTSASILPGNQSRAVVVVAKLKGTPFPPTPQGGRTDRELGRTGDQGATASVVVALFVYGAVMGAGVLLFRRLRLATAYLLTIAPVVAVTIIMAETLSRLFPAWM